MAMDGGGGVSSDSSGSSKGGMLQTALLFVEVGAAIVAAMAILFP